jgi:flagellar capping protein FliD
MDDTGQLSFDPSTFNAANIAAVQQFLGTTSGSGFVAAATSAMSSVVDLSKGLIATQNTQLGDEVNNLNSQITDDQSKIQTLENTLQSQLSAADAAIATMQSQKTYYTELFDATYLNNGQNG